MESKRIKRIGGIFDKNGERKQAGGIYSKEGLSPTLDNGLGGGGDNLVLSKDQI